MTREEREHFIREAIDDWDRDRIVKRIADRWEDDDDDTFQRGVWAGQESYG